MAENKNIDNELEISEGEALYITLTNEEGKDLEFEVIGEAAFSYTKLTEVDLSNVISVGDYAFVYCDGLTKVTLNPNGCTVGEGAFAYDTALTEVVNLGAVTDIDAYAFAYSALTEERITTP